jgi:putative hemolysin
MHARFALCLIALAALTACATPLERCINTANSRVTQLQTAILTAENNIARGYAIHRYQEPVVVPKDCHDKHGRWYRCDETEYHTVEVPVDIDIRAEQEKRDRLRRDLRAARANATRQSDQCFATYPEG